MFNRTESQKQQAEARKVFKDAGAYLEKLQKLKDAFDKLDAKRVSAKAYHQTVLAEAGHAEAKRLLGETSMGEPEPVVNLTEIRDGREKLEAAEDDLRQLQNALEDQVFNQTAVANSALNKLANTISDELNEELEEVAARLTSVMNRLYAVSTGTRLSHLFKREFYDIQIPSLQGDRNLYVPPVRHNPLDAYVFASAWRDDPEAAKLYEMLRPFTSTYLTLQELARNVERKREKAA